MPPDGDDWDQWRNHVLSELRRLGETCEDIQKSLVHVRSDIATLKVKAGAWGLVAGCVPVAIMLATRYLS